MGENKHGIVLVMLAMTIFSIQDVLIKLTSDDASLLQILFFRSVIGILFIAAFVKLTGNPVRFGTAYPFLSTCRGLLFFFGYSAFYFAQSKMPIANVTVIFLISPFFITILSIFVFGSQVGFSRWLTMLVGFFGVIIISQPEYGQFNMYYLLPIFNAFTYSASIIISKKTAEKDTLYQQVIFMYLVTAILCGILGLFFGDGSLDSPERIGIQFLTRAWSFSSISTMGYLIVISIVGTLAFLLLTAAYRISDPATITPFEYFGLLTTIVCGYLFWGDILSPKETIGMLLIVGSGMFLFYRENMKGVQVAVKSPLR